jgi:hypothetical protein
MLRLALLLLYLIAWSSTPQGGSGWDPSGWPLPPQTDGGGGADPDG